MVDSYTWQFSQGSRCPLVEYDDGRLFGVEMVDKDRLTRFKSAFCD